MKNLKYLASAGVAAMLLSTSAWGGLAQPFIAEVDLDNQIANGDMRATRNTPDETSFIGCGMRNIEDGAGGIFYFGFCQAEDPEGDRIMCFTQNPDLLEALQSGNDYSFVTFSWQDDGAGGFTCNRIGFSTQSFYLGNTSKEDKNKKKKKDDDDDDDD